MVLRPLRRSDAGDWAEVRRRNADWLRPWDATSPYQTSSDVTFSRLIRRLSASARRGDVLPFAIAYDARFVGQLTVADIRWGSACSATIGYWVDRAVAGRGVMPTAVALATDHCFQVLGLHRVEVNVRPENTASRRVAEKLGLREEGLRERLLHIDGAWCDHLSYAITAEEAPGGLLARWHASRVTEP